MKTAATPAKTVPNLIFSAFHGWSAGGEIECRHVALAEVRGANVVLHGGNGKNRANNRYNCDIDAQFG